MAPYAFFVTKHKKCPAIPRANDENASNKSGGIGMYNNVPLVVICGHKFLEVYMLKLTQLSCESSKNPLGIATQKPRFGWKIDTQLPNAMQEKYHIQVTKEDTCLWDSGEVDSCQSVYVDYQGPQLEYATRYKWRVRACVNGQWSDWSDNAWFETALEKWQAPFISADDIPAESGAKTFGRKIDIAKPIISARVYATAQGIYELHINGKPASDTCFDPGWTAYDFRLLYRTYDVTDMLNSGTNTIKAHVAPGWYKGDMGFKDARGLYGDKMAFSAQVDLCYQDGTHETILTGDDWLFADSTIIYSEIYHGETYDARKEKDNKIASQTLQNWQNATVCPKGSFAVEPFDGDLVRRIEVIKPISFFVTPKGEKVLDFGQNLTGRVRLKVSGKQGEKVTLRHAEVLDAHGNFYTENLRSAKCTDTYILKGDPVETYEPYFTFHGFRYVAIDEHPGEIRTNDFEAVVIHSDMAKTGEFSCSHPLVNQLQSNIVWGLRGNFLDIPTDCPQRDERLGWTGDAQIFAATASYIYDVLPFFRKWLRDLALDQLPEGGVPHVIPDVLNRHEKTKGSHSACGWADAAVIVPWVIYEH